VRGSISDSAAENRVCVFSANRSENGKGACNQSFFMGSCRGPVSAVIRVQFSCTVIYGRMDRIHLPKLPGLWHSMKNLISRLGACSAHSVLRENICKNAGLIELFNLFHPFSFSFSHRADLCYLNWSKNLRALFIQPSIPIFPPATKFIIPLCYRTACG